MKLMLEKASNTVRVGPTAMEHVHKLLWLAEFWVLLFYFAISSFCEYFLDNTEKKELNLSQL
jgi:hypothetical protein